MNIGVYYRVSSTLIESVKILLAIALLHIRRERKIKCCTLLFI